MTDIRISDKDIQEWKRRKVELEAEIGSINRKLELVKLVAGEAGSASGASAMQGTETKAETILDILKETKHAKAPKDIKAVLRARNASEKTWGRDYIYVHQILNRDKKRNHPMFRTTGTGRYLPAHNEIDLSM